MKIQNITKHIKKVKGQTLVPGGIYDIELSKSEQDEYKDIIKVLDEVKKGTPDFKVEEVKEKKSKKKSKESEEILMEE